MTTAILAGLGTSPARAGDLKLRAGEPSPIANVVDLGIDGVSLSDGTSISWDRVLRIPEEFADDAAPFDILMERCWRARSRLNRADWVAAEPIFEELFEIYRSRTGPTAASVSEGLMRCRLHAQRPDAIVPWLSLLDTHDSAESTRFNTSTLWGESTRLEPDIPPIWTPSSDSFTLATLIEEQITLRDSHATPHELLQLYTRAAQYASNQQSDFDLGTRPKDDPDADFVWVIVSAITGSPSQRAESRSIAQAWTASATADQLEPWAVAWLHAALGISLVQETDPELKLQGVLELLYLPATMQGASSTLTAQALASAAVALGQLDRFVESDALRSDLLSNYPNSTAARWIATFIGNEQSQKSPQTSSNRSNH